MPNPHLSRIRRAMGDPDRIVLLFDYQDKRGRKTRRITSPIRFASASSFLALCLSREEPRRFDVDRCTNLQLAPAHQFSMPVPLEECPAVSADGQAPPISN